MNGARKAERPEGPVLPGTVSRIEEAIGLVAEPGSMDHHAYLRVARCLVPPLQDFDGVLEDAWGVLEGDTTALARFRDTLTNVGRWRERYSSGADQVVDVFDPDWSRSIEDARRHGTRGRPVEEPVLDGPTSALLMLAAVRAGAGDPFSAGRHLGVVLDQICGFASLGPVLRAADAALNGAERDVAYLRETLDGIGMRCGPGDGPPQPLPDRPPPGWADPWPIDPAKPLLPDRELGCMLEVVEAEQRLAGSYRIDAITPDRGCAGTVIAITGQGFGTDPGKVSFSPRPGGGAVLSVDVDPIAWTETEITVEVPADAGYGPLRLRIEDGTAYVCGVLWILNRVGNRIDFEGTVPQAARFRANRQSGRVSVHPARKATLSWEVHPDDSNVRIRCPTFNLDLPNRPNTGTHEIELSDHPAFEQIGEATCTLTAQNACGDLEREVTLAASFAPLDFDLEVEQTQATQFFRSPYNPCPDRPGQRSCPTNDIRLIERKATVLRIYPEITDGLGPIYADLSGVLETRPAGAAAWDVPPLTPYNAPIRSRRRSELERGEADHTLSFRVPEGRCQGQLEYRLTVFDSAHPGEPGYTSTPMTGTLAFASAVPLRIRLVRIRYLNAARGLNIPAPTVADFWATAQYVLRTFPINDIRIEAESEELYDGDFTNFFDVNPGAIGTTGSIFTIMDNLAAAENRSSRVMYVSLFPPQANQTARGWAAGPPLKAAAGVLDGPTLAQELAHLCGRPHAPCGNPPGVDASYPDYGRYPSGSIGEYGVDIVDGSVKDPDTHRDFMSYCGSPWVSPYTYEALMNCFPPVGGGAAPEARRVRRELLQVPLSIFRDGIVTLRGPAFHVEKPVPDEIGSDSPYFVELHDAEGRILEAHRLKIDAHRSVDDARLDLLAVLPWQVSARTLVFKREQAILRAIAIGSVPELEIRLPTHRVLEGKHEVTWEVRGESAPLTYALRYSHDAGETWRAIAVKLTETHHTVDLDALPGGKRCYFQVLASEGVRTTTAVSAAFEVPEKPALVRIVMPEDGASFGSGGSAHFFAATDLADGTSRLLPGAWSSDIDGELGSGAQLVTHTLSPGEHRITFTAREPDGTIVSESVAIAVHARTAGSSSW